MLLSPVLLLGSYIEAKRTGKFDFQDAVRDHGEIVAERGRAVGGRARRSRSAAGSTRRRGAGSSPASCRRCRTGCGSGRPVTTTSSACRLGTATLPSRTRVEVATGGARDLRREVEEIPGRFQLLDDVPLAVPVLAHRRRRPLRPLAGDAGDGPLARAPGGDAAQPDRPRRAWPSSARPGSADWEFLKWLPHARTLDGSQLASTSHHAARPRERAARPGAERRATAARPAVLVVIDETCPVERRRLMPLLEAGAAAGIFFVWVASARHRLPKACGAVVDIEPDHVHGADRVHRHGRRRRADPVGGDGAGRGDRDRP